MDTVHMTRYLTGEPLSTAVVSACKGAFDKGYVCVAIKGVWCTDADMKLRRCEHFRLYH